MSSPIPQHDPMTGEDGQVTDAWAKWFADRASQSLIVSARWQATGFSGTDYVWGTEDFNEDSAVFGRTDGDASIQVMKDGTYLISAVGTLVGLAVGQAVSISLQRSTGGAFSNLVSGGGNGSSTGSAIVTIPAVVDQASVGYRYRVGPVGSGGSTTKFSIAKLR